MIAKNKIDVITLILWICINIYVMLNYGVIAYLLIIVAYLIGGYRFTTYSLER